MPDEPTRLVDLSHTDADGMITYKGLPTPIVCDYLSRAASRARYTPGTEFHIGRIDMVANTGTYVDSPFRRYADGKDLSELELTSLADLECLVIRATGRRERGIDDIAVRGPRFYAVPVRVKGMGTFPVRASARLPSLGNDKPPAFVACGVPGASARDQATR